MTELLASYAVTESISRGRQIPEPPHPFRGAFERDRDRIIHSAAFRRLEGKTQVFTTGLDDHYRTRLTHSIEVAQIGRTIARALNLNEALTEAICLAHDLGHPPFGHTGEHILNDLMADYGGFEHNSQALRIVDFIECPYPDFRGLNLMFETRLGLVKHTSPYDRPFRHSGWPVRPSLEGQIADIADRIAYNCHDLEDGLRSRLLDLSELTGLALYKLAEKKIALDRIHDYVIRRTRLVKTIMDILASDVIETSRKKINEASIVRLEQVYEHPHPLIGLSDSIHTALCQLETFLMQNMYLDPTIRQTAEKAQDWLAALFEDLCLCPDKMPHFYRQMIASQGLYRVVCDYIAGMTDRYCLQLALPLTQ
ncbi:MAG TPA: deoxyguanosinetriphosphate triphosphohydrolase [Anaerohalosphaeraceae bacterium]|nr:deoxyguanosinetriphosphate triphosphohydrolase [Phycisphaerae bacterium]HOK96210.1 deoxyguanosinetriphosphate triphosphohydrolase [Anaerohalosphaeraceae bacterium]HOL30914.1 deoxyguanosinetriphosphate triphosphohydrolase [Anaerohalosphaeraceae bacterium]HOM75671.1 deoxyguanosinetriphosphate triphosphohydrolase [Anaerohalosphaeraceae bacterium]HPC64413.1 deoxyguanosinetriphosphate triphosphohydrolase [Anaerohalosphaeraceae bacterium]